jgi:hypothetical protein
MVVFFECTALLGDLGLLLIGADSSLCFTDDWGFGAALEESDVRGSGEGRVILGEDEQKGDEARAKS